MIQDQSTIELPPKTEPQKRYQFKNNVYLLGCPIACLTLEQTVQEVNTIIQLRDPVQHCVVNAAKLVLMSRQSKIKEVVHTCALINADGQSVVWTMQLLNRPVPERVTGIDLMERLLVEADRRNYRIYFLGAAEDILQSVLKIVRQRYPGVVVAGQYDGYFDEAQGDAVVQAVAQSNADILFVAMSSPKKELWMAKNLRTLNVPFCMGVGGSFDIIAGKTKRAPRWVQDMGMEWFYRLMQEPRRLWRRYLIDNLVFVYLVLKFVFKKDQSQHQDTV